MSESVFICVHPRLSKGLEFSDCGDVARACYLGSSRGASSQIRAKARARARRGCHRLGRLAKGDRQHRGDHEHRGDPGDLEPVPRYGLGVLKTRFKPTVVGNSSQT